MIYKPMTTERFVQLAKAIHGDLYDYSDTVYESSQRPVTFGCNRCGRTVRLSQAQSHLRARKPCGCKPCRMEKLNKCGSCNKQVSSKSFNYSAKKCDLCVELGKSERRKATVEKHSKQCKGCGSSFSHRHKAYCSEECRKDSAQNRMVYTCSYCEKRVRKKTVSTSRFQFCNRECQNAFHASVGYCETRKEAARINALRKASRRLKKRLDAERSVDRRERSEGFAWWSLCRKLCCKLQSKPRCDWDRKITTACRLLTTRPDPVFKLAKQRYWTWSSRIASERASRLRSNKLSKEESRWMRKLNNAAKNSRIRLSQEAVRIGKRG
jgi:hypothetical protein